MGAVYLVAVHNVTDQEKLQQYLAGAAGTLGEAEVLAADETVTTLEGDKRGRTVILRFPSEEALRRWYDSPEYAAVRPLRLAATTDGWTGIVKAFGE